MKIHICAADDNPSEIDCIVKYLRQYPDLEVHVITSFEELEDLRGFLPILAAAFIDMQFGRHTGFEVLEFIRRYNPNCIFTLFTNYAAYLKQGYEYRIYRYILKDEPEELIEKQVKATLNEYYKKHSFLRLKENNNKTGNVTVISLNDVMYIEVLNHTAIFHLNNGETYSWNKPLSYIAEECLDERFIRCHRAYLVNTEYIAEIEGNKKISMQNKETIDIGYAYRKKFLEKYRLTSKVKN